MKADLKCETTDLLQSRQKGSAEVELPIFGNEGRVLVEKPIFRSLAVEIGRKCRCQTANHRKSTHKEYSVTSSSAVSLPHKKYTMSRSSAVLLSHTEQSVT